MASDSGTAHGFDVQALWIDRVADAVGAEDLAVTLLGERGEGLGPHLILTAVVVADLLIPPALVYAETGAFPILETPAKFAILPIWLYVLTFMQSLRRRYRDVVNELSEIDDVPPERIREHLGDLETPHPDDPPEPRYQRWLRRVGLIPEGDPADVYAEIVPGRVKAIVLVAALGVHATWFVVDPSPMSVALAVYGPTVAAVEFFLIVPVVFYTTGAELVSVFLGVHLLLPLKVSSVDRIDFTDQTGFLGLRPLGRLIRYSSLRYVVFLGAYLFFEAIARGTDPFDPFARGIIVGGTVAGALFFLLPAYWLHKFMKRKKEERVDLVTDLIAASGPDEDDDIFPNTMLWMGEKYDGYGNEDYHQYTHLHIHLTRIERAKEFPVDVALALEFLFVLLLPYLAHVSSIYVFDTLLHG